jgi:uncharacterized protein (DUF169 family)
VIHLNQGCYAVTVTAITRSDEEEEEKKREGKKKKKSQKCWPIAAALATPPFFMAILKQRCGLTVNRLTGQHSLTEP